MFSTKGQRPLLAAEWRRLRWRPHPSVLGAQAGRAVRETLMCISQTAPSPSRGLRPIREDGREFVAEHGDKPHGRARPSADQAARRSCLRASDARPVRSDAPVRRLAVGTSSPEAVVLAHKFCQCMDSSKTGLSIKPRVRIQDSKQFAGDLPAWGYDAVDESDPKDWFAMDDSAALPPQSRTRRSRSRCYASCGSGKGRGVAAQSTSA